MMKKEHEICQTFFFTLGDDMLNIIGKLFSNQLEWKSASLIAASQKKRKLFLFLERSENLQIKKKLFKNFQIPINTLE